jgi:hypothetical protein
MPFTLQRGVGIEPDEVNICMGEATFITANVTHSMNREGKMCVAVDSRREPRVDERGRRLRIPLRAPRARPSHTLN